MNIKKFHDENFLNNLVVDKKELNSIIIESKGYVLHIMEKKKIFPPLDFLIDDNNPYKLLFIIKNYELSREQIKEIRKYFSSSASNKVASDLLSQEEIEQYLQEKILLPSKTILNLETLNKFTLEIEEQFQIDDYATNDIINNSVKLLTLDQFLSIDEKIFKWNINAFNAVPHFFNNKQFKEKYIKLLFDNKSENFVRLHSFRNFHFFKEDMPLLKSLFIDDDDDEYSKVPYKEVLALKGASKLISKIEYFRQYNSRDISDFTNEELEKYKNEIQNVILEKIPSRHYDLANYLLNISASQEQFEYIINEKFLINFINKIPMISLNNESRDSKEYKKKSLYLKQIGFNLILNNLENENIINKFSFNDVVKTINYLVEKDSFPVNIDLVNNINIFYNSMLPKLLVSENFSELLRYDYFINKNSIDSLELIATNNPIMNLLAVLLSYEQKIKKNKTRHSLNSDTEKKVVKIINSLISKLDRESVKKLTSYYEYSIPLFTMLGNNSIDKYENNFLNVDLSNLQNISEENINLILEVDESFKKNIIQKKILLPVENIENLFNRPSNLPKHLKFIIDYVRLNKEQFLQNKVLLTALIKEPLTKSIIQIDTKNIQVENYKNLLNNYKKEVEINLLTKPFHNKGDYESEEYKTLENKTKKLKDENVIFKDSFTFDFVKEKIEELIKNKNFEEFIILKNYSLTYSHHDIFYNYVNNSNFNNVLKDLENLSYCEIIKSTISYYGGESQNSIQFSKFNKAQNNILAGMLLELAKTDSESSSSEKIFQLFPYNKKDFLNDFIVKNMPLKMFYSYELSPKVKNNNSIVTQVYTNSQIIDAFNNIEKSGNFFNIHDNNLSCSRFFENNFMNNEKAYHELLEFAKNNSPKLYVILGNKEIFSDFLKKDDNKNNDELISDYFLAHFDTDVLLKGFKQIFEEIKKSKYNYADKHSYNSEFALSCIRSVIHNTYYDKDINHVRTYLSPYSTKDSEKMVEFFFNEAPLFLMNSWMVGNISLIPEHISTSFGKYIKTLDIIDKILVSSEQISESNFSISPRDDKEDYRAKGYLSGMINHYLQEEKELHLDYISFLIERDTFFQDELNCDSKTGYVLCSQTLDFIKNNKELKNKLNISQSKFSLDNILSEKKEIKTIFKRKKI